VSVRAGLGAGVLLVCVFAALAVSVVGARDGLDRKVTRSFDHRISRDRGMISLGCLKFSHDFYDCKTRSRAPLIARIFEYRLWLMEDGCWIAGVRQSHYLAPATRALRGCLDE
jgi:hypothetical protein